MNRLYTLMLTGAISVVGLIWILLEGDDCTRRLVNGTIVESKVLEYESSGKGFKSRHLMIKYHYVVNGVGYIGSDFFCSFPFSQIPQEGASWSAADKLIKLSIKGSPLGVWIVSKHPINSCLSPDRTISLTNYSEYRGSCVLTNAAKTNKGDRE